MKKNFILLLIATLSCALVFSQTFNLVADVNTTGDAEPEILTQFQDKLMFIAIGDNFVKDLYYITETNNTPVNVTQFPLGSTVRPYFQLFDNKLFYAASQPSYGTELWVFDGINNTLFTDINAGGTSSLIVSFNEMAVANNLLFFVATTPSSGKELYKTDGTTAGTKMVKEINAGANNAINHYAPFMAFNNQLYFTANNGVNGEELWVSDGSDAGTKMVSDIELGPMSSLPRQMFEFNNKLFFVCSTSAYGWELWTTDGTAMNTALFIDLYPGVDDGVTGFYPAILNNQFYFMVNDPIYDKELYISDGTPANTKLLADINMAHSSNPSNLFPVYGSIYFSAKGNANNQELWKTDGVNTTLVKEINPSATLGSWPKEITFYNGKLYFIASDENVNGPNADNQLYELNLSNDSIRKLSPAIAPKANPLRVSHLKVWNDKLYFKANYDNAGSEVWSFSAPPTAINAVNHIETFNVFPNPARDIIRLDYLQDGKHISVMDVEGKEVINGKFENQLNVSHLSAGSYLIEVSTDEKTYSSKFIKN